MSREKQSSNSFRGAAARFTKSSAYGLVAQVITIAVPLVMMPPMLNYFGEMRFGFWISCVSLTSMLVFLDLGTGNALTTRLSQAFSAKNLVYVRELIAGAVKINVGIFLIFSLLSIFLLYAIDWNFENDEYVFIALPVFIFFLASFPSGIIYKIYHAENRMLSYNILLATSSLASAIVSFMAIRLMAPYWLVVSLLSGLPVLISLLVLLIEIASRTSLQLTASEVISAKTGYLFSLGSRFFILSILTSIGMNSDVFLIASALGPEAAANSAIPIKIGSVILVLIGFMFMPLWSMHAQTLASGNKELVLRLSKYASVVGFFMVLFCGMIFIIYGRYIINVWMGREFSGQTEILIAITAFACAVVITSPYNMVLNSQGLASVQILPWLLFVSISVVLKIVFLSPGSAWIAPALSAVGYAVFVMPLIFYYARNSIVKNPT